MLTVAYLANRFPSPTEPYVVEEIEELRCRDVRVIPTSARNTRRSAASETIQPEVVLKHFRRDVFLPALWLCLRKWKRISPLVARVVLRGEEGLWRRIKALALTWLGACYAVQLREYAVDHVHVHHGYFASWIGMVAARLLDVGFSLTLHGSDLLLHAAYLDVKLEHCRFCVTVSEYNRRYILEKYPAAEESRIVVSRLGAALDPAATAIDPNSRRVLTLLAAGRLHRVKDHAFLVRACAQLRAHGVHFECFIAGEGPERRRLESLIRKYSLGKFVTLLGHVPREQMDSLYARADVVVLTSRSEGIPLVLMEAMAHGKIVLAPAITGIPELVIAGKTGFLFEPGSQADFVSRLLLIHSLIEDRRSGSPLQRFILSAARSLDRVQYAAQVHVRHSFNRKKNLESFADLFMQRVRPQAGSVQHENSVLQQIQFSVQRHRGVPV
jgi:colanic acid/amylovoran biosynthesis glycosyltransferase